MISTSLDFKVAFWMYFEDRRKVTAKIKRSASCVEMRTSGVYILTKLMVLPTDSTMYSGKWLNSFAGGSGNGKL